MNLGVPGITGGGSRLDFIEQKANQLFELKTEQDKINFESQYYIEQGPDGKPVILGQGMHATIYKCYKKDDLEKKRPFATKEIREDDEEKRMAHKKEFDITSQLNHENVIKSQQYFFDELKK